MAEPKTRSSKTRNRVQRRRRPVSVLPPTTASSARRIDWKAYAYPPGAFTVISDAVPSEQEEALLVA